MSELKEDLVFSTFKIRIGCLYPFYQVLRFSNVDFAKYVIIFLYKIANWVTNKQREGERQQKYDKQSVRRMWKKINEVWNIL